MRIFYSTDHVRVKGRGMVFTFEKDQCPEDLWDLNDLRGERVRIDGVPFEVRGVETFAIHRSPDHPYRLGFGLLV